MHICRIRRRNLAANPTATISKGAQSALLFSGLGIASVLLVASGIMASPNATGSNPDESSERQVHSKTPSGMVWIPGGTFLMGTNDKESFPNERPAHFVQVQDFWMDQHDVTNAEFSKFVEATRYVTTAEHKIVWEDLKKSKPDVPYITNLRLDPFERTGWPNNGTKEGAQAYFDWFKYQFWRFVFVQQVIGKELQIFLDYPPMQRGASFNLDAVKAEMAKKMQQAEAASKGPQPVTEMTFTAGGSQGPPAFYQSRDPFNHETHAASVLTRCGNKTMKPTRHVAI